MLNFLMNFKTSLKARLVNMATTVSPENKKKIRYIAVGAWNTMFSYIAFVLLYFYLNEPIHYMAILVLSQIVGLTNAYICYKLFVFKTKGNILKEYFRFYVVYGSTLFVNFALILLFVELFEMDPIISQGIIALIVAFIAYVGHSKFSFISSKI